MTALIREDMFFGVTETFTVERWPSSIMDSLLTNSEEAVRRLTRTVVVSSWIPKTDRQRSQRFIPRDGYVDEAVSDR